MPKVEFSLNEKFFNNKDVDQIIRYCSKLEYIIENINIGGFQPSYCKELYQDELILIPMVSFCNIPLTDVGKYLYYGDYGLGFSLDWAVKNKISSVNYVHENSEFSKLANEINISMLTNYAGYHFNKVLEEKLNQRGINCDNPFKNSNEPNFDEMLSVNKIAIKSIQFMKFWKNEVEFDLCFEEFSCNTKITKIINSYNEREWRYVPELSVEEEYQETILETKTENNEKTTNPVFTRFIDEKKPHLKDEKFMLKFLLEDLKYIIVKNNIEVNEIVICLNEKYGKENVYNRIIEGKLKILTKENIMNDF